MNQPIEWLYLNNNDNTVRYVLGEKGKKMIACIGINPSTAIPDNLDDTLKRVKKISINNGYDGWLMLNVYPRRSTDIDLLEHDIDNEIRILNREVIRKIIIKLNITDVWLAYGDLIQKRSYLPFCLFDIHNRIKDLKLNWKIISDITLKGHPRHPLYQSGQSQFVDFDAQKYIAEKIKPQTTDFDKIYADGIEFK